MDYIGKLTRLSGEPVWIEAREILFLAACGSATEIGFVGGGSALVREDHDTIDAMKRKAEGRE